MRLDKNSVEDKKAWEIAGYSLPKYDRTIIAARTKENPEWLHFGAGNIFRAFQASVVQNLLNEGVLKTGLIVAEGFDYEIIDKIFKPHDNYNILVTLKSDGNIEKAVIGSVVESLLLDHSYVNDFSRLMEIFRKDSLKMVSFTITEKGYNIRDEKGEFYPLVAADMEAGPDKAGSYMGKVTALVYERFKCGNKPISLVSMDNCSHNGDKLRDVVLAYAELWAKNGLIEKGFMAYLEDDTKVAFPWTMIDKITPRPDPKIEELLEGDGVEEISPIITSRNTYIAPFVNAEESQYLVIEDAFPNGKIVLENGGVIYADKVVVDKVEKMKVCTCLNPLHTALAVFGCLLGYTSIHEEMKDDDLVRLVHLIGYKEGLPVVINPEIIKPKDFIDQVVTVRLPNPFMPDTPQRIATDTSQKLAIRYGETIKAYMESTVLDVLQLEGIPLVFAGWLRYLMGMDDMGKNYELSPDPMLSLVCPAVENIALGDIVDVHKCLEAILSNEKIFGVNLYEVGLGLKVEEYFNHMIAGTGAVRAILKNI